VLFVTEALRGVVPKVGPDLDQEFNSEQGRTQILQSRRKEEIRSLTQNALLHKNACGPFKDKM
jgi:hypothetical protein